jgi:hypothetical protein
MANRRTPFRELAAVAATRRLIRSVKLLVRDGLT